MHRFNPKHAHVLNSGWRQKVFPAEEVVEFALSEMRRKEVAVDVGAGTGYLTVPPCEGLWEGLRHRDKPGDGGGET